MSRRAGYAYLAVIALGCVDSAPDQATVEASDTFLALPPVIQIPEPTGPDLGSFRYEPVGDAMTDVDQSYIITTAVRGRGFVREAQLRWRCAGPEMELIISAAEFLTTRQPVQVQWRLDEDPASEPEPWLVSTEGTAAFAPEETLLTLTDGAVTSQRLRTRLTDCQQTIHDYEFSLVGLEPALAELSCSLDPARQRRAARIYLLEVPQRTADSLRAAEEGAVRFLMTYPFAGDPDTREYVHTVGRCWRFFLDSATAVFFRRADSAQVAGYTRSEVCR